MGPIVNGTVLYYYNFGKKTDLMVSALGMNKKLQTLKLKNNKKKSDSHYVPDTLCHFILIPTP